MESSANYMGFECLMYAICFDGSEKVLAKFGVQWKNVFIVEACNLI